MQPSRDIQAEMNSVEFYQAKGKLGSGTYQIKEHDGDTSYAVVDRYSNVTWYSSDEYEDALLEIAREQENDFRLDQIMRQGDDFDDEDREELMDSWDKAMVRQEDERLADEISHADYGDADMAVHKTLGQLLREHLDQKE